MTTRISKVLTVFVTMASVAFMAVVMANVMAGGPNWKARAAELKEVAFEQANPQAPWTSKRRTNSEDTGGGAILPAAIVAVQKKLIQQEEEEAKKLDDKILQVKSLTETNSKLNQNDLEALKRREAELAALYLEKETAWKKLAGEITAKTEELTKITGLSNVRSEESIRYKHQIEELAIEKQQIEEEVRRLKDLVYQANANWERAKTRQSVLVEDGAKIKEKDYEPKSN
jgi:predicted transcriptional regulator